MPLMAVEDRFRKKLDSTNELAGWGIEHYLHRWRGKTFSLIFLSSSAFIALVLILFIASTLSPETEGAANKMTKRGSIYSSPQDIPVDLVVSFDVILVLGGGVPSSIDEPPVYVQRRCDDAAAVVLRREKESSRKNELPILCLSAGTAHMPQLLNPNGLPIWESMASASYLQKKHNLSNLYIETTSYDTIGNAFFARTSHTDISGWRNLLIVTNEFHMERSKAIFDWIFSIDEKGYKLYYLSSPDIGLSEEALEARRSREHKSLLSVQSLTKTYRSLSGVWSLLNHQHDLYTASKLVEHARKKVDYGAEDAVKKSYGASS